MQLSLAGRTVTSTAVTDIAHFPPLPNIIGTIFNFNFLLNQ